MRGSPKHCAQIASNSRKRILALDPASASIASSRDIDGPPCRAGHALGCQDLARALAGDERCEWLWMNGAERRVSRTHTPYLTRYHRWYHLSNRAGGQERHACSCREHTTLLAALTLRPRPRQGVREATPRRKEPSCFGFLAGEPHGLAYEHGARSA